MHTKHLEQDTAFHPETGLCSRRCLKPIKGFKMMPAIWLTYIRIPLASNRAVQLTRIKYPLRFSLLRHEMVRGNPYMFCQGLYAVLLSRLSHPCWLRSLATCPPQPEVLQPTPEIQCF